MITPPHLSPSFLFHSLFTSLPFMHICLMSIKQFILFPINWINKIISTSNFPIICTINFIIKNEAKWISWATFHYVKFEYLSLKLWPWSDRCLAPSWTLISDTNLWSADVWWTFMYLSTMQQNGYEALIQSAQWHSLSSFSYYF